jgi:hypothetical protein
MSSIKIQSKNASAYKQNIFTVPESVQEEAVVTEKKIASVTKSELRSNKKYLERMEKSREASAEKNIAINERLTPMKSVIKAPMSEHTKQKIVSEVPEEILKSEQKSMMKEIKVEEIKTEEQTEVVKSGSNSKEVNHQVDTMEEQPKEESSNYEDAQEGKEEN